MIDDSKFIIVKLNKLEDKLKIIEDKLEELKKAIFDLTDTTKRMDNHISFVEATYETLKKPLDFVKEKVNYLTQ
tara:strand:+ start:772 stop:993 length:222 start_codon:yes stop_codon:yes gene_type:complete